MQTLEEVIEQAYEGPGPLKAVPLHPVALGRIATAVRAFLGSDEVVEKASSAYALSEWQHCDWPEDFSGDERERIRKAIRAALSSIGGE